MAKATPQQQSVKDTIVLQATRAILSDEVASSLYKEAQRDPVEAIINTTATVMKGVKQAAASQGRNYVGQPDFILGAAKEVIGKQVDLLVAFQVVPAEQKEQIAQQAFQGFAEIVQPPQGMLAQEA